MIRALVTGAGGFVGRYLVRHLAETGRTVFASTHAEDDEQLDGVSSVPLDITDLQSVNAAFALAQPDEVYHLAAIASPVGGDPIGYLRVNVEGTMHILLAAKQFSSATRVLTVSSGLVYGECHGAPATEDTVLRPLGLYAASKASADLLASSIDGVQVLRVRPFNHTGPGQAQNYFASSLARQVAEIALGRRQPLIELGNLHAQRDFTDVRDVVKAYRMIMENGTAGEAYNVCSGTAVSVEELARAVLRSRGIDAEIRSIPALRRAGDIQASVGSPSKGERIGWARQVPLEQTLADLVAHWENVLTEDPGQG